MDILKRHRGVIGIRRLLSKLSAPPIQEVIDQGVVPELLDFVKEHEYPQLQMEAAWALVKIVPESTVQRQILIERGAVPLFVELLKVSNIRIVEQAVWIVG
jgi:importin subunit alpha-6/7